MGNVVWSLFPGDPEGSLNDAPAAMWSVACTMRGYSFCGTRNFYIKKDRHSSPPWAKSKICLKASVVAEQVGIGC